MTSNDRFDSINADPTKANLAQGDDQDAPGDNRMIELDLVELSLVGGARIGKVIPEY